VCVLAVLFNNSSSSGFCQHYYQWLNTPLYIIGTWLMQFLANFLQTFSLEITDLFGYAEMFHFCKCIIVYPVADGN